MLIAIYWHILAILKFLKEEKKIAEEVISVTSMV